MMITDTQQWHYTDSHGQQAGPVTTTELRALVEGGQASSESMVWTDGMENWTLASQVEGLIAPKAAIPSAVSQPAPVSAKPTPDTTVNPYAPPLATTAPTSGDIYDIPNTGGIGRLVYFLIALGLNVVQQIISFATISGSISSSRPAAAASSVETLMGASIGLALIFLVLQLVLVGCRYKNIGFSPWWCLLYIVPIANLVIGFRCLTCQPGYAFTRKLDRTGKIIAWVILGLFVAMILIVILAVAIGA
ncbi:MAG: GYF domain-containing protein [Akkermansiaceae bacterium]